MNCVCSVAPQGMVVLRRESGGIVFVDAQEVFGRRTEDAIESRRGKTDVRNGPGVAKQVCNAGGLMHVKVDTVIRKRYLETLVKSQLASLTFFTAPLAS
jgi:hypothetical protein